MMLVVSDTSPLTALIQIGRESLLSTLFGRVVIPIAVRDELLKFHSSLPEYLEILPVNDHAAAAALELELDCAKSEAIILAKECQADYLLIDGKSGRSRAKSYGLQAIGLLGVLLSAEKEGKIESVGAVIDELEAHSHLFASDDVTGLIWLRRGKSHN